MVGVDLLSISTSDGDDMWPYLFILVRDILEFENHPCSLDEWTYSAISLILCNLHETYKTSRNTTSVVDLSDGFLRSWLLLPLRGDEALHLDDLDPCFLTECNIEASLRTKNILGKMDYY